MPDQDSALFRQEAVDAWLRGQPGRQDPLRIIPGWTGSMFWFLAVLVAAGVLYVMFGRIREYAEGPAVVSVVGGTELTARSAATVKSVNVDAGDDVEKNDILITFHGRREEIELERINQELDRQILSLLRDLMDQDARQAVTRLRAQKRAAEQRLEQCLVSAPHGGAVADIRIRPGQQVAPGDHLLTIAEEDQDHWLIAFLPGHWRPQIEADMELRFEPSGYKYAYQPLTIASVEDEIIGPGEVRRYLPQRVADTIAPAQPVVIVKARLPGPTFVSKGQTYRYYDGMVGVAAVRLRSEPMIFALIPALKSIVEGKDG